MTEHIITVLIGAILSILQAGMLFILGGMRADIRDLSLKVSKHNENFAIHVTPQIQNGGINKSAGV